MFDRRTLRLFIFLCVFLGLVATAGTFCYLEQQQCMHVPLIQEAKLQEYTAVSDLDITQLRFNGEKVAADLENNTVYISQPQASFTHFSLLEGTLDSAYVGYHLFFLKDTVLQDIPSAVESGTPLTLIITHGDAYQSVNVVISPLAILRLDGEKTHEDDEKRAVFTGTAALFAGLDPATGGYTTTTTPVQWHIRGNSTASQDKTPWKLSLKNREGENKDLDLLGLGADDDWVLNSLTMDDTRIREKLFMDLWNTIAAETDYNYKMSTGEYVEVVINGNYMGLFLLQRRLDAKYLELEEEDVLLKVTNYQAATAQEAYEFVTPEVNTDIIYGIMQGVFEKQDSSGYPLYNVIDVNLLLQLANARDNYSLKNMYHVLKKTDSGYTHYLLPWDTDQSFGLVWKNGGFAYDYEIALNEFGTRMETSALKNIYPEYPQAAASRWQQLRKTTLSEDNILSHIDALYNGLTKSGALTRDVSVWSNRYEGADTVAMLKRFVSDRLLVLDNYYQ